MTERKREIRRILHLNRVSFPEEMLRRLGLKQGDYVHVDEQLDHISIKPVRPSEVDEDE